MIWKIIFIATFAIGVFAEINITEEQRNQAKEMIKNYCKKNGAEDKAEEVAGSITGFVDCVKGLFNYETVKKEVEEAKPNGALDEVFKKYCAKSPQLKTCIHNLAEGVKPCLDVSIREKLNDVDNATDKLIDFVCYKDGDRIALFIAENGPECFQQKVTQIRECGMKLRENINSLDDVKSLSTSDRCAKYDELTSCIVKALEECDTPTPGNMAESLFRYIRNSTPCKK